MTSNHKIDWLSICLPLKSIVSTNFDTGRREMSGGCRELFPHISDWLMTYPDWKEGGGNRIFNRTILSSTGGFHIFWKDTLPFSLIEIEGTGIQNLRSLDLLKRIIKLYAPYLTRIDIATDWETSIPPREFHEKRDPTRFASHSEITSDTGETCYVGSKESDRYARTYRYSDPHPRSKFLRCEFVLRKNNAKAFASALQSHRLSELTAKLFRTFGYCHPLIGEHQASSGLLAAPRNGSMGNTERWLFRQVLPAVKKLVDNGNGEYVNIFMKQCYDYYIAHEIKKDNAHGQENLRTDPDYVTS